MYTSIDMSAHALQRKLVKYKERRTGGWHGSTSTSSVTNIDNNDDDAQFAVALEETIQNNIQLLNGVTEPDNMDLAVPEFEEYVDTDAPSRKVVPIRSFQLDKSISLDEAIFALDYVDHDFYVFRNEKTKEINVIYKRHHGGIGWIEP
jgi:putative sigma-54 modulation protein